MSIGGLRHAATALSNLLRGLWGCSNAPTRLQSNYPRVARNVKGCGPATTARRLGILGKSTPLLRNEGYETHQKQVISHDLDKQ